MESAVKVAAAAVIFAAVQYFSSKSMGLSAALAANIPFFTVYAYLSSSDPKDSLLYIACFTGAISLSFFAAYLLPVKGKVGGVISVIAVWLMLTAAVFSYFKLWR